MQRFDYAGSVALVTGASRGIGASIVRELAQRGSAGLVLTARTRQDLEALTTEIRAQHSNLRIEIITADLSDPEAPAAIKAETDRMGLTIDLLVNNAGFGSFGPFETLDLQKESDMIAVNVAALVTLTRLYLPGILAQGRGGVLNVGSTAAFQPVPYMSTYGATKAFVQSFSEGLWAENQDLKNDVRIVCLCPGGTETNFGHAIGVPRTTFEKAPHTTPEEVASRGLDALDRGELYAVVGALNYVGTLLSRVFPRSVTARVSAEIFRPEERKTTGAGGVNRPLIGALLGVAAAGALVFGLSRVRAGN